MKLSDPSNGQLFISDIHLGGFSDEENERIEAELIQLINFCQRNQISLVILGDLFDYWMEYPDHVPELGKKLLNRFESYNKKLGPTLYITGNHDNWTRDHLAERGFQIENEYRLLDLDNNNVMVLHGDGLADHSMGLQRPLMHRILRNEKFISLFQNIFPPAAGIGIMKYFSKVTRYLDSETDSDRIQKLNRWSQDILKTNEIDYVMCGHDHQPRRKQYNFGTYINLGTFYRHRTMAYYNNNEFALVTWSPQMQSLKLFNTIDE